MARSGVRCRAGLCDTPSPNESHPSSSFPQHGSTQPRYAVRKRSSLTHSPTMVPRCNPPPPRLPSQDLTRRWLSSHFPDTFDAFLFGNHYSTTGQKRTKADMCKDVGAVALIDDSVKCVSSGHVQRPHTRTRGTGTTSTTHTLHTHM